MTLEQAKTIACNHSVGSLGYVAVDVIDHMEFVEAFVLLIEEIGTRERFGIIVHRKDGEIEDDVTEMKYWESKRDYNK
jgi:hypothetical protein